MTVQQVGCKREKQAAALPLAAAACELPMLKCAAISRACEAKVFPAPGKAMTASRGSTALGSRSRRAAGAHALVLPAAVSQSSLPSAAATAPGARATQICRSAISNFRDSSGRPAQPAGCCFGSLQSDVAASLGCRRRGATFLVVRDCKLLQIILPVASVANSCP